MLEKLQAANGAKASKADAKKAVSDALKMSDSSAGDKVKSLNSALAMVNSMLLLTYSVCCVH